MDHLNRFIFDMSQLTDRKIIDFKHQLKSASLRMQVSHPHAKLQLNLQKLDLIDEKLHQLPMMQLMNLRNTFKMSLSKLLSSNPRNKIKAEKQNLEIKNAALLNAMTGTIERKSNRFSILATQLEGASPLQLLSRGYAVVTNEDDQNIKTVKYIKAGTTVRTKLSDGSFVSNVEKVETD